MINHVIKIWKKQTMSNSFDHFLATSLNIKQKEAVLPKDGVMVVCAGAGSGKTRVITARIANLIINHNVPADSILALTFTNKAAKEMKERVAQFLPHQTKLPFVGTFHSYCLKTLKSNPNLIKFPQFSLIDQDDKDKLIKNIIKRANLNKNFNAKSISSAISRLKNEATSFKQVEILCQEDAILSDLYKQYEIEKSKGCCFDFDDLLLHTLELFNNIEFKERFQNKISHILVDEYQDTNIVQHALLKKMSLLNTSNNNNNNLSVDSLCVVGDEDQSIYSWRGANVSNILNFSKEFPNSTSITVEQNYRSVKPILDVANAVITYNSYRNPKKLWSEKDAKDRVRILACNSSTQEAHAVAHFLKEMQQKESLSSCAILYRSHYQSRSIEEALIKNSVPYKIVGGIQFYERLEIKDLLAYLRLIINPQDRLAFSRVINTPLRGLGDKFQEQFFDYWDNEPFLTFKETAQRFISSNLLNTSKIHKLEQFLEVFKDLTPENKTSIALKYILEKTNYKDYLEKKFEKEEVKVKKENIKEFIEGISYFEAQHPDRNIDSFLEEVSLLQELQKTKDPNSNLASLMTFHAAKGLEFDTVIIVGLEEGILPSSRSLYEADSLEEERRLFYVGLTRARERVLLTRANQRFSYGQLSDQHPSRFLDELDHSHTQITSCNFWDAYQFENYFNCWLSGETHKPLFDINSITTPEYVNKNSQNRNDIDTKIQKNDNPNVSNSWKKFQTVKHAKFGIGIIEQVEQKKDKTFLSIRFKDGIKKLDSSFITV